MSGIAATSSGWPRRILLALGLAAAVYQLLANVAFLAVLMGLVPHGGVQMDLGACAPDRFCEVKAVRPGPASAAGVRAGDQLHFDRAFDAARLRFVLAGDRIGATLRRGGATRHVEMIATPAPWTYSQATLTSDKIMTGVGVLTVIVGVFVMMRGRSRLSVFLLGAGMVCAGGGAPASFWSWRDPAAFATVFAWLVASSFGTPILFFAFARQFRRETSGRDGALGRWAFWGLAAADVAAGAWRIVWAVLRIQAGADLMSKVKWWLMPIDAGYVLAFLTLAAGWREAPRSEQARYGYIVPAVLLIATAQILVPFPYLFGGWDPTRNPVVLAMDVLPLAGLLLLVYAVLRHKVIDLGFAVNRTLVYGVVSALLLASFGLIEWAVDHFVPIEGREKNALVDAVIAVGVFLTFHRVRDVVEEAVEGLFFRRWQKAEAALRLFVREAAFITEGAALMRAFAQALTQLGEGAQTAVYLRDGDGYARASGEVECAGARLEANLRALVSVRADPKAREIQDGPFAGALIAPMVNRNEVLGVVLLSPKPSGHGWRPDEIELIGWATRQVGLDLHALEMERLEASQVDLHNTVAMLRTEITALRSVIPQRA